MAAIPKSVLRQREKLEAELGLNPPMDLDAPADPALTPVPPVETSPAPPIQAEPQVDSRDARIVELEHLLRTRDGQTSASTREANEARSRADLLASQVSALEDAVAELTKQKDHAQALAAAKRAENDLPSLDDEPDLSPEDLEKFGGDSVGFVKKLSRKEMLPYMKALVAKVQALEKSLSRLSDLDRLPQLEKVVKSTQDESQRIKDEEFFRTEVLAHFPDFTKVREQQDWKDYLATDVPGKGFKVGHLLNHYRHMYDAMNIRTLLQGYYDRAGTKTTLSSLAVPTKTQTEGSVVTKPKLKASEYVATLKKFTSRQMPKPEWEAYKTAFTAALNEGRVEHDARL